MRSYNRMLIIGNMGNDPELRYTPSGDPVCNVNVACNGFRTLPNGQREDTTDWFRLVAYNRNAENLAQYGGKGRAVFVEGRLRIRPYTAKDGSARQSVEIIVGTFILLDSQRQAEDMASAMDLSEAAESDIPF